MINQDKRFCHKTFRGYMFICQNSEGVHAHISKRLRGTCSSVGMLKGFMVRERLGTLGLIQGLNTLNIPEYNFKWCFIASQKNAGITTQTFLDGFVRHIFLRIFERLYRVRLRFFNADRSGLVDCSPSPRSCRTGLCGGASCNCIINWQVVITASGFKEID